MSRLEDWFNQRDENEQKMESVILSRVEISNDKLIADLKQENKQLKQQIEKMKCCENCVHFKLDDSGLYPINVCELFYPNRCKNHEKWEIEK